MAALKILNSDADVKYIKMDGTGSEADPYVNNVLLQDQVTAPFHRYLMTEEKTDITLTAAADKNDVILNVSAGHGFATAQTPAHYILINYGDYTQQSLVTGVSTNAITIATPIGIALPTSGVQIVRGAIDMNIDASSAPVKYYCRPGPNSVPVDIINIHVYMISNAEGDDSKFGGGSALTNGVFVREENGVGFNLGLYKKNQDFLQYGAHSIDNYTDKSGGGNYSARFPFDLKDKYGIVRRLDPEQNGHIYAELNDDLDTSTQGLVEFRITLTGQLTKGE